MNPRHAHRLNKQLKHLRPVYFLLMTVFFAGISIYALRQNNFKMIQLRDAVVTADQQNGDVETALQDLRRHVYGHMNTNLSSGKFAIKPPIQLKGRYDRLITAELERTKQATSAMTAEAERICTAQFPATGYNPDRVTCMQQYVAAHAVRTSVVAEDLYKFDFVSPKWSPDLAGWSLVAAGFSSVLFILRLTLGRLLKHLL